MASEDRIECPKCGRAVLPQLWVDTRNGLEHPTVHHLCPYCGVSMRISGGGINRGILAIIIGSLALSLIISFGLALSKC